jgi:hypothetical protein
MVRLTAALTLLLLAGCGSIEPPGWLPKRPPQTAATAAAWAKPGADAATVQSAYDECLNETNTASRSDFAIDQDISATRSSDLQRSEFAQSQMQQTTDTDRARAQAVLTSCMTAKGFSPAGK